jgi:hypothetical protein
MKSAIILLISLVMLTACAKKETRAKLHSDEEYRKLEQPGPAAGRAELVSPVELLPDPAKFSGRRVVLAGIWSAGFEHSLLNLENSAQDFWIWVDADWAKIDGPAGDFAHSKEKKEKAKPDHNGHVSYRILAEGTFYYREPKFPDGPLGFGHMSISPGYFIIDRLFRFDPVDEEPNQPAQSTRGNAPRD